MSNDQVNLDVQAVQARAKLRSGRMRSLVRDLTEAADGLDVWCQLADELAMKRRQHGITLERLQADYDAENARLTAALETARAQTRAAQTEAQRLNDDLPQLRADVDSLLERKTAIQGDVTKLQAHRDAILKQFNDATAEVAR